MRLAPLVLAALLFAGPALAVRPDEILRDPVLEARARALSQGLRCLVCRNEDIDESDADLAHDLRVLLRERLVAGDSDDQAMAYIVDRYGEFVLLKPRAAGANLILWLSGPALLLAGGVVAFAMLRRRSRGKEADGLSEAEAARVKALMGDPP
jgi:cytochrome c-type biogenesis protein CcmH